MSNWLARVTFRLAACVAARRFVRRRRNNSGGCRVWDPILLHWRGRHKGPADIQAVSKMPRGSAKWLPHLHLHLGILQSDQTRRSFSRVPCGAITKLELQRIVHEHQWMMRRKGMSGANPQPFHCLPRPFRYATQLAQRADAGIPISIRSRRLSIAAIVNSRDGGGPYAQGMVLNRARGIAWTEQELAAKSRLLREKLIRQWTMLHREAISRQLKTKTIVRRQTDNVSKHVWRHGSQSSLRMPDQGPRPEVPLLFRRQPGGAFKQEQVVGTSPGSRWAAPPQGSTTHPSLLTQPIESPSGVGGVAIVQGATIDPILLNRLTDNVIRRVEQRVRIERERRGL